MSFLKKLSSLAKSVGNDIYKDAQRQQEKKMNSEKRHTESHNIDGGQRKPNKPAQSRWKDIGTLDNIENDDLRHKVGVYKADLNDKTVYVGRATEYNNGGFKKRLSDYTRESDSGRKHKSGQLMHENASELKISIISTGSDKEASKRAKKLETEMIKKHDPDWNVQH